MNIFNCMKIFNHPIDNNIINIECRSKNVINENISIYTKIEVYKRSDIL